MNLKDVKIGLHVKIVKLGDTKGMLVTQKHIDVQTLGVDLTVDALFSYEQKII